MGLVYDRGAMEPLSPPLSRIKLAHHDGIANGSGTRLHLGDVPARPMARLARVEEPSIQRISHAVDGNSDHAQIPAVTRRPGNKGADR